MWQCHIRRDAHRRDLRALQQVRQKLRRIRLVCLIGTPKEAVTDYLKLVAALSRWLKNPATRAALLAASTEHEFRALLGRSTNPKR